MHAFSYVEEEDGEEVDPEFHAHALLHLAQASLLLHAQHVHVHRQLEPRVRVCVRYRVSYGDE